MPVLLVQMRRESAFQATVYAHAQTWPPIAEPQLGGRTTMRPSSPPTRNVASVVFPFRDRAVARLLTEVGEPLPKCIVFRGDQFLRFGDVYSVGHALQEMPGAQLLIFPELALD